MSQGGALGSKEMPVLGGVPKKCPDKSVAFAPVESLVPLSFEHA